MLEQFVKNCSLWEGPTLEKFVKDCLLWEGPHDGAGEDHEEEEVAETKCYELTVTPIPCPPVLLEGKSNGHVPGLADGQGIAAVSVLLYWTGWNSGIPLKGLWPKDKSTLDKVHLEASVAVDEVHAAAARGPKLNTVFEVRPHQCRVQGDDHFPSPAGHAIPDTSQDAIGFLGHLGTLLAHIQPAVNQHPQRYIGLLRPKCRTRHLALLNLIQLASAHRSSLSRSLCRAFLPSRRSTLPHNLVSSANLLRVHSIPSSRSLIKILNKTDPNTEPWGTPLVTGRQLELTPLTTTLWPQPSSQFFTQRRVHPSKP
ncbi:hypothetical protein QYF61_008827 [Mycteria americana]|uniref:Uncharacterized protein n=1 Tax=Mycteria americana TaxID=33587 RepID=A0AAN7MPB1_MYCAM|nr:hypothetical protein QYF61_008827 [Mycteria americana]